MKKKAFFCLVFILVLMLIMNGCSLQFATIEELISPPQVQALNSGILAALENKIGAVYTLKTPASGENRSAFILSDLDGNGSNEAVAFYQLNNKMNTVRMMFFQNNGESWQAVQEIEGQGNDVYSVSFADFNNDGVQELVVGWESYNNKTKRGVSIFSYQPAAQANPIEIIASNLPFSAMAVLDIDEDLEDDLLLFSIDTSKNPSEASAKMYGYDEQKKWGLISETQMDGSVSAYTNVFIQQNVDGSGPALYIDGNKGDSAMITEIVRWDSSVKALRVPNSGMLLSGLRVPTRDVNRDGVAEIAVQEAVSGNTDSKYVTMVRWNQIQKNTLRPISLSLINFYDGYMINVPESWASKVVIRYNPERRSMVISEWSMVDNLSGREVMNILAVPRSEWKNTPYSDYTELLKSGELVYVAKMMSDDADLSYQLEELKRNIVVYM